MWGIERVIKLYRLDYWANGRFGFACGKICRRGDMFRVFLTKCDLFWTPIKAASGKKSHGNIYGGGGTSLPTSRARIPVRAYTFSKCSTSTEQEVIISESILRAMTNTLAQRGGRWATINTRQTSGTGNENNATTATKRRCLNSFDVTGCHCHWLMSRVTTDWGLKLAAQTHSKESTLSTWPVVTGGWPSLRVTAHVFYPPGRLRHLTDSCDRDACIVAVSEHPEMSYWSSL